MVGVGKQEKQRRSETGDECRQSSSASAVVFLPSVVPHPPSLKGRPSENNMDSHTLA